jgi:hypothetical protein
LVDDDANALTADDYVGRSTRAHDLPGPFNAPAPVSLRGYVSITVSRPLVYGYLGLTEGNASGAEVQPRDRLAAENVACAQIGEIQ